MEQTLDLKYRPQTYGELIGQTEAVNQLQGDRVRSYVFFGPSGVGKTTSGRIFARNINAELIELDSASLGKQDIEKLKLTAYHKPMFHKSKIILLDEVHNLSKQAWDSLLKVIEEGPEFLSWILATTEFAKVPETIRSRSRMIEFRPVKTKEIVKHLKQLTSEEEKEVSDEVIHEIASYSAGGVRKAVKMLETYITTGELGLSTSQQDMIELIRAVYTKDHQKIHKLTEGFSDREVYLLISLISDYITMILLVKTSTVMAGPMNDVGEKILREQTNINPELVDDLREMQADIANTFAFQGTTVIEQTVNTLYGLMDTLMRHYMMFEDKEVTTRSALQWFSNQLP